MLAKFATAVLFKKSKAWVLPALASVLSLLLLFFQVGAFRSIQNEATQFCKEVEDVDFWVSLEKEKGDELAKILKIPEVTKASYILKSTVKASNNSGLKKNCLLIAVDESTGLGLPAKLSRGNHKIGEDSVIVSSECAKSLFLSNLMRSKNQSLFIEDRPLKLIGVSENQDASVVYTTISKAKELYLEGQNFICVKLEPYSDLKQLRKKIERVTGQKAFTKSEFSKINFLEKLEINKSMKSLCSSVVFSCIFVVFTLLFMFAYYFSSKTSDYELIHTAVGSFSFVRKLMALQALILANICYLMSITLYFLLSFFSFSNTYFNAIAPIYGVSLYLIFSAICVIPALFVSFKLKEAI
jgi:hypothetical protein